MKEFNHDDERAGYVWQAFKQSISIAIVLIAITCIAAYYLTR